MTEHAERQQCFPAAQEGKTLESSTYEKYKEGFWEKAHFWDSFLNRRLQNDTFGIDYTQDNTYCM